MAGRSRALRPRARGDGPELVHPRNYGDSFFFEGRFDEAAAQYEQALAIEPRTATTLARLGTIELRRGDADGAIGHFAAALRVKPDMDDAAGSLASALESRGMPPAEAAAAVASLRTSIDRSQADLGRPYGREYRDGLMRALWQANTDVVVRCHGAVGQLQIPPPAFDLFLTVDPTGTVAETGSGPASPLGRCIAEGLVGARVPAPPFAPFHAWVTMRL